MSAVLPLHCGCHNAHFPSETSHTSFTSSSDEIAFINEIEVPGIEEQIRLLYLKRALSRQRLNEIQSPPNSLPPEILGSIIEMSMVWPYDTRKPLMLGTVSSYWRSVVYSTPQLWTFIKLDKCGGPFRGSKMEAVMQHAIKHSKDLPLYLYVRYPEGDMEDAVRSFLQGSSTKKIEILHVEGFPIEWFTMSDSITTIYPYLQVLHLISPIPPHNHSQFTLPDLPSLRHLQLSMWGPAASFEVSVSTRTLTRLDLCMVPISTCIRLLLASSDTLTEYICRSPKKAEAEPEFEDLYTIPRLETFEWDFEPIGDAWYTFVLANLDLPSLRNAFLEDISGIRLSRITIPSANILTRCLSPLSSVTLSFEEYERHLLSDEGIQAWLGIMNTHKLLVCRGGTLRVCQNLDPSYNLHRQFFVENLKILAFEESLSSSMSEVIGVIVHMLEERLSPAGEGLTKSNRPFILALYQSDYNGVEISWGDYESRIKVLIDGDLLRVQYYNWRDLHDLRYVE